ncbi:Intracellular multiplication protein IcmX [Legionella wadsworthii]|uniref:Intracellular multiplication protein IcmX n=1 Tax=Legionella wadsworthii TaxID=28088 RepID=A0A378LMJ2_9GAMM|nr:type IVB secretion system protein IcmX [Legionella wadsworthii]STY28126.1 Intracellular multiplication protein IcmX [Legionella wadsworthii]
MKLLSKRVLVNLLCFTAFPAAADNSQSLYNNSSYQTSTNTQKMVQYLQNLGSYLGFDVTTIPTQNNADYSISYKLINLTTNQLAQTYQFYTLLGSIPVNTFAGSTNESNTGNSGNPFSQFLPNEITGASALNALANNVFQNYNNASTGTSEQVGVSNLIDQQTYQQDPVSQAVLNILGTPDYTYCMDDKSKGFVEGCSILYETLVPYKVIGTIPATDAFFTSTYIQPFLNQLNSNALTAPLMYSTQSLGTGNQGQGNSNYLTGGANQPGGNSSNNGLTAQNQEQLAANFIRYVTGSVVPIQLPKRKDYDQLYFQAATSKDKTQQMQAEQVLAKYLAGLRTYAAQSSVGISNLYYIMSKRMPQTQQAQQNSGPMSQALTEYNMATWRLYTPGASSTTGAGTSNPLGGNTGSGPQNTQWINSLNNAAPATVEKEIAILLAEINYQLYLDRQIHERLLMTNSILLLQSVRTGAPSTDFTIQTPQ